MVALPVTTRAVINKGMVRNLAAVCNSELADIREDKIVSRG